MRTKTSFVIAVALGVASLAGAQSEDRFTRTVEVGPNGELSLSNVAGDIRVSGVDGGRIEIEAVKRYEGRTRRGDEDVQIEVLHTGNRVRVETRYPRGGHRHGDHGEVSVHYTVSVPRGTEVELQSVSGDVVLSGVHGRASVRSVSGSVSVEDARNLQEAKSVSGDVDVRGARSERESELASVSGDINVEGVEAGELTIESVSGDVIVDAAFCRRGTFTSVSGDLRYTGRLAPGGRYELESHSGDVVLTLTEDIGFELESSTFSGDIESDFPLEITSRDDRERELSGVHGDGSAFIEASTFSGSVRIRRP